MTTIKLKNGSGAPTAGDLVTAEPALDLTNKRLYTEDSGGTVIEVGTNPTSVTTGDITATGTATFAGLTTTADVSFGDNDKAVFGAGSDLQIYHSGATSFITENGTGDLRIGANNLLLRSDDIFVQSEDGTVNSARFNSVTGVTLYRADVAKLATTSTGIDVTGTVTADGLTVDGDGATIASVNAVTGTSVVGLKINNTGGNTFFGISNSAGGGYLASIGNYATALVTESATNLALGTNNAKRLLIDSGGDISFYEDTGTTAKLFWDASAESLKVEGAVKFGNTSTGISLFAHTADEYRINGIDIDGNGFNSLHFRADGTDGLFIEKDTNNVGIGTDSPSEKVHLSALDHSTPLLLEVENTGYLSGASAGIKLTAKNTGGGAGSFQLENYQNNFRILDDATERMRIDSSGNLCLNSNGSIAALDGVTGLQIGNTSVGNSGIALENALRGYLIYTNSSSLSFWDSTDNSERMQLDASGNLLVGKTSGNTIGTAGIEIDGNNNRIMATRDGNEPLLINRLTSDGTLVDLKKDGTTVGSIGTSGQALVLGNGNAGFYFNSSLSTVMPWSITNNTNRDASIDIGQTTNRFKDLYLSGGAYLGGTGSANYLDDYEEGTFTPELRDATSGGNTATTTHKHGLYTKVGSLVTIWMHFRNIDTTGMTSGNPIYITGLPFTADNNLYTSGAVSTDRVSWSGNYLTFSVTENDAYGLLSIITSNAQDASLTVAGIDGTGSDIQGICVQYRTA